MQRARPRPARSRTLAGARQHDPTALGPVDLTVMDRPVPLARDQQILREAHREQPLKKRASVVADDARPNARLALTTDGYRHCSSCQSLRPNARCSISSGHLGPYQPDQVTERSSCLLRMAAQPARPKLAKCANQRGVMPERQESSAATTNRMSPLDASFLAVEDAVSHMHIGSVAIFEGPPPRPEELREMVLAQAPARAALPPGRALRRRSARGGRCGSTTRTSTSTTTCAAPRCRHPAARQSCAGWSGA